MKQQHPKANLLIIEDDLENKKFLTLFLGTYFEVDSCDSSESFYDFINKKKYDLFLMDISIKGSKNGLELTQELKLNPSTASIPVVCYTAHAFQKDKLNALAAGCDEYISKPSSIYLLLKTLQKHIDKKTKQIIPNFEPSFSVA